MKKFNLLSILILFFSLLNVQSVVGQTSKVADITSSASPYTVTYSNNTSDINVYHASANGKNALTIDIKYPVSKLNFQCSTNKGLFSYYQGTLIVKDITNNSEKINKQVSGKELSQECTLNTNTNQISIYSGYKTGDMATTLNIKNTIFTIAPHILIDKVEGNVTKTDDYNGIKATATSTKSIKVDFGSMRYDANEITATINIKSLLATGELSTNLSNKPNNCFTIEGAPSSDGTKATLYKLNTKSFTVKFNPKQFNNITTKQNIEEKITISDAGNPNNDVEITLTATVNPPQPQTITWNQEEFNKTLRIDDKITLNATASSNLNVTYTSSDNSIASINGDPINGYQLTIHNTGTVTITASQGGDGNYQPAPNVSKTITTYQYNVSNLQATETAYKYVKLSWDPIYGAESYSIYEGNTHKGNTKGTETTFTITGLTYGSSYTYTIKTNDTKSYTQQSSGTEITTITTPDYPSVQNITFPTEKVTQNSITVNWDPVTNLLTNHTLVQYHVRLYKGTGTDKVQLKDEKTKETTYTFDGLVDASDYTVCVNIEYEYTLDGNKINVQPDEAYWSCNNITTATFIPNASQGGFDDVQLFQGEWYRIKVNATEGIDITDNTYTMDLYYPCQDLKYEAWLSATANGEHYVSVDATEKSPNLKAYTSENRYKSPVKDIEPDLTQIKFTGENAFWGQKVYVDNIYAKIAPHIEFDSPKFDGPTTTISLGDIEIESTSKLDIDFKSFLAMDDITITSDNEQFLIGGTLKEKTIDCGANYLCKTNNNSYNFSVTFTPKSLGEHTGIITITDGTTTKTITITAKCIKKTPTITWTENRQIAPEQIVLNAATSDCGTAITYTSSDESVIRVENEGTALVAVGIGTAQITATTAGNDTEWKSTTSYAEFEVTDKKIQNIVWDQTLSLLKFGADDIILNAYTIDKETGEPNNLTVEYSSANTDIVTVDNGVLKIVGKGQTTITANQRGNDKYAGAYMTKIVIVREVSDDCSSDYALVDNGQTWDKGGFNWAAETHTCELSTVGEYLTFTTTKTGGLLPTTGGKITVTDEHGEQFYSGGLGTTETVKINRNTTKLTFTLEGNRTIGISEILVTPAIYLETQTKEIVFPTSEYGKKGNTSISFDWANQPDYAWATIIDDTEGVFSVDPKTFIFGGTCGSHGTSTVNLFFNPTRLGDFSAKLVVYVGEGEGQKQMLPPIPITATAIKAPQFIFWEQDINPILSLPEYNKYTLDAITSSGLDVIYTSSNESVARIENGQLVIVGAGNATITASQPGNENYEAAGNVTKNITVDKLNQTITWNQDLSNSIIGETYTLTASASSGLDITYTSSNDNVAQIVNGNQVKIMGVGTATITASQSGNTNYNATAETKTLNISKHDQTITWTQEEFNKTLRIGDKLTLNASVSSGLPISYNSNNQTVATINGNQITIVGAGEVTITASQSGTDAYNEATSVQYTITTYQYNVSNLQATETAYKYVILTWDAIVGADSYSIFEGNTLKATVEEGTSYTIKDLDYASTHTYTIKTNDAESYTQHSSGTNIEIKTVDYPKTNEAKPTEIKQNEATIEWSPVSVLPNHELLGYYVRVYKKENNENKFEKEYTIDKNITNCTIEGLLDNTTYTAHVGVKYKQNLDGQEFASTDIDNLKPVEFTTTSFITKNEPFDGVKMYQGKWYRVNLYNEINISSNTAATAKQNVYTMPLNYPCEPNVDFQINTSWAVDYGTANIKIDESKTGKWDDTNRIHAASYKGENSPGTAKTSGHEIKALQFYCDGGANSDEYVHDIGLKIAPHILLNETRYIKNSDENVTATETTEAILDFGTIEIGLSKAVNIDFKSFLSVGELKALLSDNTDSEIFWLNSVRSTKELHIADDNTLEEINTNTEGINFTISFNPTSAGDYEGKLIIKDNLHTVTITLKATCVKKTPEITWVNDKYISLGDFLAGAAFSTLGNIEYSSSNTNIINPDGALLNALSTGSADITASIKETDTYYAANSTVTFTVTDKIIQSIVWDQDFSTLKIQNELTENDLVLNAKAITRETGEENGNEITYSSLDKNIVNIVDGKLQIVNEGFTYITALQQGNDEYAPTYMTKIVFVRRVSEGCDNFLALDHEGQTFGDGEILSSGFDWGPFVIETELETVGDKLSFTTSKHSLSTQHKITITDDLGNIVHTGNLGTSEKDIQIKRDARKLTFTLNGNLRVNISDIKVTPAIYLEADDEHEDGINFASTEVDFKAIEEIYFNWANQPDYIWATIIDDPDGVFLVDSKTAIFGSSECGKYGTSPVKVIFTPKKEADYNAQLAIYVGENIETPLLTIPITGKGTKAKQEIFWLNYPLTTADKEVNIAKTTASSPQPITYTILSGNDVAVVNGNNTITILNEGKFTLRAIQEGNDSYLLTGTIEKEFTTTIGNLIFDNKAGDNEWTTAENWKPDSRLNLHRNITTEDNITLEIADELIIKNNTAIETEKQLTISNGNTTIQPQGELNANIINIDEEKGGELILQADENGSAILTYNNTDENKVNATVQLYSIASSNGLWNGQAGNFKDPKWQYLGVVAEEVDYNELNPNGTSNWIYLWDETKNANYGCWAEKMKSGSTLKAWNGYGLAQEFTHTYTYSGSLVNGDHTYQLTHTPTDDTVWPDLGNNLITNSYTAPIDITTLKTDDFANAEATIYIYNTGGYNEWKNNENKMGHGPGQFIAIPVESAEVLSDEDYPKNIASGQAFFVFAIGADASFSVNYENNVCATTNKTNIKRSRISNNLFNVLKIQVVSSTSNDRLYLLEHENTTADFDNGYETNKIFDNPNGPQIYATTSFGYTAINCDTSFNGQSIGFVAHSENEIYTMTFDIEKLHSYEQLWLFDTETELYVNILKQEEYQFYASTTPNNNRFYITTVNPNAPQQDTTTGVIDNSTLWNDILAQKQPIYLYNIAGQLIGEYKQQSNLPAGVYLIRSGNKTTKLIVK